MTMLYISLAIRLVAPHAGAWIETLEAQHSLTTNRVAPHAGAWIETSYWLKKMKNIKVAPHAGAWIETQHPYAIKTGYIGRPPRGGVD